MWWAILQEFNFMDVKDLVVKTIELVCQTLMQAYYFLNTSINLLLDWIHQLVLIKENGQLKITLQD